MTTRAEILSQFKEILASMNSIDKEKIATATEESDIFDDLGAASSEIVNIMAKAEGRFDVEFDDDEIDSLDSSIAASLDLIEKAMAERDA